MQEPSINNKIGQGVLFRDKCKAKDGWIDEFVTLEKKNGKLDYRFMPGTDFAYWCMDYIHKNAVDARLVKQPEKWLYCSARDYAGIRGGTICNLALGRDLINFI